MNLSQLLKYDPLTAAEEMTGKSYKTDRLTENLGLAMHILHVEQKDAMLKSVGDSTFSNTLENYLKIIESAGFEFAKRWSFKSDGIYDTVCDEFEYVYAHRELGIVLHFDTHRGVDLNSGSFYYCWRPDESKDNWGVTSSGGFESEGHRDWRKWDNDITPDDLYWEGNHDCREAIKFKVSRLKEHGTFLPKWPSPSSQRNMSGLYLMNYMDWRDPCIGYHDLFTKKYSELPEWVKEIMGQPHDE